ncbi:MULTISPECIES: Wzz/FepE/Etk N-terminal domain-containing protein [Actinomadura]|uniref:Polysaccharide chain length determinant N-terminal domain-containing protein n=1 Tax=Actinomadura miaoliensis TaxID=430685 RepID=A0ABP7WN99_9ACTN
MPDSKSINSERPESKPSRVKAPLALVTRKKSPRRGGERSLRPRPKRSGQRPGVWRFARHLVSRVVLFVFVVLLGALGGLAYALLTTPVYKATSHVIVVTGQKGSDQLAVNFAQAYGRLAAQRQTLAWAVSPPVPQGANPTKHVQASTSPDTPLIQLTGSARTADGAVAYANAAADALVRYSAVRSEETGVHAALMSAADRPSAPASPNLVLSLAIGTATGILLAGLLATVASGIRGQFREYRRLHPEQFQPPAEPAGPAEPAETREEPVRQRTRPRRRNGRPQGKGAVPKKLAAR